MKQANAHIDSGVHTASMGPPNVHLANPVAQAAAKEALGIPVDSPGEWDVLAGVYPTSDGWVRLHTNFPHHKA